MWPNTFLISNCNSWPLPYFQMKHRNLSHTDKFSVLGSKFLLGWEGKSPPQSNKHFLILLLNFIVEGWDPISGEIV